jgi:Cu+-exporting ATPase
VLPERVAPVTRLDPAGAGETPVHERDLLPGDLVRVRAGEIVPADGTVVEGRSFVDASALTGESQPGSLGPGERVHAGSLLVDGTLVVRTEAAVGRRLRDEIERLLREALASRSRSMRLADRIAGALLPLALGLAALTVARRWGSAGPEAALLAGLSVVLISCPCALGIATPLVFWSAMGAAWRRGVLVRGGAALEALARVRCIFLDKTGTLTSGEVELAGIQPVAGLDGREALRLAAALETGSEHPIARSLRRAWTERAPLERLPAVEDFRALPGRGVSGRVLGRALELVADEQACDEGGATRIVLREGGQTLARIALCARPRPEARAVIAALRARGYQLEVLTGDAEGPARALGQELGVAVVARLSPAGKVERVRESGVRAAFVGDGLNDAAALAAAEVGITVAGASATSLSAAEVNLLRPGLSELAFVLELARRAVIAARLNLAWAFLYNAFGLYFAATGRLSPVFAASAMVVSSAFSGLNSRRILAGALASDRAASPAQDAVQEPIAVPEHVPRPSPL